jgi:ankyrin repeat protein
MQKSGSQSPKSQKSVENLKRLDRAKEQEKKNAEVVDLLLNAENINPNLVSPVHGTPLHVACRVKNFNMVQYLLLSGVNFNLEDQDGKLPIDVTKS